MKEKHGLTECVEFTTGAVAFIGYKLARLDLTPYGLGIHPGYIIVMFRRELLKRLRFPTWEKQIPGYYVTRTSRDGVSIYVALSNTRPTEHRVRSVIEALKAEGYLSRSQELVTYIGLGLSYRESAEQR